MARIPVLLMVRHLGGIGGTERQTAAMAMSLDPTVFEAHVGCLIPGGLRAEELHAAGFPVLTLNVSSFASKGALAGAHRMRQYIAQHKIRIVHTFDVPMNIFGVPVARMARTPVVLSSQRAYRDLSSKSYRLLLRLTDAMVDGIVVNCDAIRRHLVADYNVRPNSIHLCYNAIDTAQYRVDRTGRDAGTVTVGVVCAFRPEKGLDTLLDAFAQIRHGLPHARLLLVGAGSEERRLRLRASELGFGEACSIRPATANVAGALKDIDIFVLPSLSEALSNSLMEAMAAGCCPVASDVGGNPELVIDGQTGLVFRAGDTADLATKLQRLLTDADLRRRMAQAAANKIEKEMTLQHAGQRLGEIYHRMLTPAS